MFKLIKSQARWDDKSSGGDEFGQMASQTERASDKYVISVLSPIEGVKMVMTNSETPYAEEIKAGIQTS